MAGHGRWRKRASDERSNERSDEPCSEGAPVAWGHGQLYKGRNYDPTNYHPQSLSKSQDFIFGTPKWKAPANVPKDFALGDKYVLREYLTDGTFGRCFAVMRSGETSGRCVAKIMRPVAKHNQYIGDATIEATYLHALMKQPGCPTSIVRFFESVVIADPLDPRQQYHCLIFEECDASLHEYVERAGQAGKGRGSRCWHPADLRSVARQLLDCCQFLHSLGLAHTDIKHKNVMLKSAQPSTNPDANCLTRPVSNAIRVIDFGNMTHKDDYHTAPIGTRQFRAPEVQLGLMWDEKFDLWGVGCVLHWMFLGRTLFEPHTESEQLDLMQRVTEVTIPSALVERAPPAKQRLFDWSGGRVELRPPAPGGKGAKSGGKGKRKGPIEVTPLSQCEEGFANLMWDLWTFDPRDRPPAAVLLQKHSSFLSV